MKRPRRVNSCISLVIIFFFHASFAGDVPIERDFLSLRDGRWIWLKKVDQEKTQVILGQGPRGKEKVIWTRSYESGYENEAKSLRSWEYAYFVRLKPGRFEYDLNGDGYPEIAISTYDFGNNMIRKVLIYSVRQKALVFLKEQGPFNIAADESLFH